MIGEVTGLPLGYLLGEAAVTREEPQFYHLQAEETFSSLEETDVSLQPQASSTALMEESSSSQQQMKSEREKLRLNLEAQVPTSSGLIFSPGGSEAYVFTASGGNNEAADNGTRTKTPRQLDEKVFLEYTSPRETTVVGERPKTVGQSDDGPKIAAPAVKINRNVLQGRLEDLRSSLEHALGSDELSSAQQSTEVSPRRYLPRLPMGGLSVSEHEDTESMPSPSITRRGALSPSMASVTSGSTTASGAEGLRRRNLEWDSGADLGYEGNVRQKEAAATLSTLEKLAIGNYSNFLRTEPEGKPTIKGSVGRGQQLLNRLPGGTDPDEDLRQVRLHKFADSLLNQRQFRSDQSSHQKKQAQERPSSSSSSKKVYQQVNQKSKSDTSPEVSPMRRKLKKRLNSPSSKRSSSAGKSSSLTDLTSVDHHISSRVMICSRHSTTDLSPRSLGPTTSGQQSTDPSSSSSTSTVVPQFNTNDEDEIDPRVLEALNTDPSSLPVELQALMSQVAPKDSQQQRNQQSQTSLNSRQSEETVITLEQLLMRHKGQLHRLKSKARSKRQANPESDSLDTDEEIELVREQQQHEKSSAYFAPRNGAEGSESNADLLPGVVRQQTIYNWLQDTNAGRAQSLPPLLQELQPKKPSRQHSMTTSEDERQREKNTSTLESAPIDRAKSFEYFPGESYPLQENSSSYEYLPGHMIHDTRPPTVVSNRPEGGSSSSNIMTTTSPSVQSTSSNAVVSPSKKRRSRSTQLASELARISNQLMEKSNHLHSAKVHQTMAYYSRLKDYISFISTPSLNPSDARLKQQIADKILDVMKMEEDRLQEPRPLSSLLGLRPDFLDPDDDTEPPTRQIGTSVHQEDVDDHGHHTTNNNVTNNVSLKDDHDGPEEPQSLPGLLLADTNDLMIQKLRIGQMKKLRKEIRKLEKLEKIRLEKAMSTGGGGRQGTAAAASTTTEAELLRQIAAKSDDSSVTSFSCTSEVPTETHVKRYRGVEGKSSSGSDNNKQPQQQQPPQKADKSKRKPSVSSVREFAATQPKVDAKDAKVDTHTLELKTSSQTTVAKSNKIISDFGQTYPTPRPSTASQTVVTTAEKPLKKANHRSSNASSRKPMAYYLPMDNQTPIRIGMRVLKEKKAVNDEFSIGKENRNLLANYLSSVDSSTMVMSKGRPKTAPEPHQRPAPPNLSRSSQITLQDALMLRKPNFIQRSSMRVDILRQIRDQRLIHAERHQRWLDEVAKAPPLSRTTLPPPPTMPKMLRLFSYREMVTQAREKYEKLPEIVYGQSEAKRKNSYQTNRLKADMYKKRLQSKVLHGRGVSLTHHNNILWTF